MTTPFDALLPYPPAAAQIGGCRVSRLYYTEPPDAELAAANARRNSDVLEARGFDFGMVAPGSINRTRCRYLHGDTWIEAGWYEVTIPD